MKKIILFLLIVFGFVSINIQAQPKTNNLVGGYKIESAKNMYKSLTKYILLKKSQYEKQTTYEHKIDSIKNTKGYNNLFNNNYSIIVSVNDFFNDDVGFSSDFKLKYDSENEEFSTPILSDDGYSNSYNKSENIYNLHELKFLFYNNWFYVNNKTIDYQLEKNYNYFYNYIIKCSEYETKGKSYVGSNAYGASKIVEKSNYTNYYILDDDYFSNKIYDLKIKYPIKYAKNIDRNIKLIITFKNKIDGKLINGVTYHSPTMDSPHEWEQNDYYFYVSIQQIDFYDIKTNKIIYTVK